MCLGYVGKLGTNLYRRDTLFIGPRYILERARSLRGSFVGNVKDKLSIYREFIPIRLRFILSRKFAT